MIPASRGSVFVAALALLLIGCEPRNSSRPGRPASPQPSVAGAPAGEETATPENPRTLLWSTPVTYHGVEVRFEIPQGFSRGSASIRQTEFGDRITSHGLELSYRYQRFETPGGGRCRFEPGSRVFVFGVPSDESPWTTTTDRFEFTWLGNGVTPVVREDRRDGSVVWIFRRVTLELTADRRSILYKKSGKERRFTPPVTLVLDARGRILEEQSRLR